MSTTSHLPRIGPEAAPSIMPTPHPTIPDRVSSAKCSSWTDLLISQHSTTRPTTIPGPPKAPKRPKRPKPPKIPSRVPRLGPETSAPNGNLTPEPDVSDKSGYQTDASSSSDEDYTKYLDALHRLAGVHLLPPTRRRLPLGSDRSKVVSRKRSRRVSAPPAIASDVGADSPSPIVTFANNPNGNDLNLPVQSETHSVPPMPTIPPPPPPPPLPPQLQRAPPLKHSELWLRNTTNKPRYTLFPPTTAPPNSTTMTAQEVVFSCCAPNDACPRKLVDVTPLVSAPVASGLGTTPARARTTKWKRRQRKLEERERRKVEKAVAKERGRKRRTMLLNNRKKRRGGGGMGCLQLW